MEPFDNRLCDLELRDANERLHAESGDCWKQAEAEVKQLGNYARFFPSFIECQLESSSQIHGKRLAEVVRDVRRLDGTPSSCDLSAPSWCRRLRCHCRTEGSHSDELGLRAMRTGEHSGAAQHYLIQKVKSGLQGNWQIVRSRGYLTGKRGARDLTPSGLSAATAGISLREDAKWSERIDKRPGSKARPLA